MSTSPRLPRRFALGAAVALLIAAPLSTFAADTAFLRMGLTRTEVEKSINAKLVEDPNSMFKNAFAASEATEALRNQLPQPISRLDYHTRMFYFNDEGKLWRVRLAARQPATEGFAAMVDTAALLERDARLKRVRQENSLKSLNGKIPVPTHCYDQDGNRFKLGSKNAKLLADRWKTYSQPERYAVTMNLGCNAIYLGHRFVTPAHLWHTVNFEGVDDGPGAARFDEAVPTMAQVDVVYVMVQASAAEPDLEATEESMHKPQ